MAGMFCTSNDAAERLRITEEQLKELVKEGKLREFRDGGNLILRTDEVEALASKQGIGTAGMPAARESFTPKAPERQVFETPMPSRREPAVKPTKSEAASPDSSGLAERDMRPAKFEPQEAPAPESQVAEPPMRSTQEPVVEPTESEAVASDSSGLDAADMQSGELEAQQVQAVEPKLPDPDMTELVTPIPEERSASAQIDEAKFRPVKTSAVHVASAEEIAAARAAMALNPDFKAEIDVEGPHRAARLSIGQWLLKGLREDDIFAIFVILVLLCIVFSIFAVLGSLFYLTF